MPLPETAEEHPVEQEAQSSEIATPAGPVMDPWLRNAARRAIGFMPDEEGFALYQAALEGAARGPLLEIGTYCGRSTIYLAAAAKERGEVVFTLDHHRGSEEHQPGEGYHDPRLVDPETGRVDTLGAFRRTIALAGLEDVVVAIVGRSEVVAARLKGSFGLVFIDGSHSREAAFADLHGWSGKVAPGGLLAIHDVFEDPAEGGRPPYEIYREALASGAFSERSATGSLRVLKKSEAGPVP